MLPEKIKQLEVDVGGAGAGQLLKHSESDRKYQGSYQRMAELLRYIQLDNDSLAPLLRAGRFQRHGPQR